MKRRNDQSLTEALEGLVNAYGLREKLDEQAVVGAWDEIAGAMVARHTVSVKLRRGKLHVKVDSAPLRQELGFLRQNLITTLNERFGREVVKEVVLD
ncbi:MAG TPA: DUF721 domain-containing protein [Flavobacteriales bacterium]